MPKTKTSTVKSKSSKSSNKLVKVGKLKFDKTLLIVTMVVLAVGAGWLWYKGSHAATSVSGLSVPRNYLCYTPHPTIQQGSTGDCVKYAQWTLANYANQNIAVDGSYGPATTQAVKNLQAINHLSTTGSMDAITWERLDKLIQPGGDATSIGSFRSACKNMTLTGYAPFKVHRTSFRFQSFITYKNMGTRTWPAPSAKLSIYNTSGQFVYSLGEAIAPGYSTSSGHTISINADLSVSKFPNSNGMYILVAQVASYQDPASYGEKYFGPECKLPFFVTD